MDAPSHRFAPKATPAGYRRSYQADGRAAHNGDTHSEQSKEGMMSNGFFPCTADGLRPGDVVLDGPTNRHMVVAEVILPDKLGKIHVSPGKVKLRIKGIGNLWVCDAGHEFMTRKKG